MEKPSNYLSTGNAVYISGEGAPLVVLGGGPGLSSRVYRMYLEPIIQESQLICWDYAATGNSPAQEKVSFEGDYRDLLTLLESTNLKKIRIFAHSYGGMLALKLAHEQPELVDRMMLLSCFPNGVQVLIELMERKGTRWTSEDVDEVFSLLEKMGEKTATSEDLLRFAEFETKAQMKNLSPEEIKNLARISEFNPQIYEENETWLEQDFTTILSEIKTRTLVGIGKEDNIVPREFSEPLLQIPGSILVEFENSAHWALYEEPRAFARVLNEFLVAR
jgi:proline iminopeptidase